MATVLGQYKQYQERLLKKISDGSLKQQELLAFQELNYRIATLELMQAYCRTAPVTTELGAIGYHYQLVIASFRALLTERRFGPKGDEQKVQQRTTALKSLEAVFNDQCRRFQSFNAGTPELYRKSVLEQINAVEGFDPRPFAVDYTDLGTGQTRKRLPVMIQMAWFRLRYPEGKISVEVTQGHDCFVAKARVYPNYRDPVECYLAEATASRGRCQDKPSVSPREWAQTAAVGIALRNAGFGLQFSAAGEDFSSTAPDEFTMDLVTDPAPEEPTPTRVKAVAPPPPTAPRELTPEEKLEAAMRLPCPIKKFSGKTLGDLVSLDPKSLVWLANKYTHSEEISAAAKLICESALNECA